MKGSASLKLIFKFGLFQSTSQCALSSSVHGGEGSGRGEERMGSACGVWCVACMMACILLVP